MFLTILQTIFSFIAVVIAIYIPEKIKWEQIYLGLMADYRSYDFASAFQGVIDFFVDKCNNDIEAIPQKYKDVVKEQNDKNSQKDESLSNDKTLHFQRRLLAQFYWELYECAKSPFIGKRRVRKDCFGPKEANLIKILFYMDKAIDEDESGVLKKDISSYGSVPKTKKKNMNSSLSKLYYLLKD